MPGPRNAYEILGLPRDAVTSQIRSRYRQLARRYSRDLSVDDLFQDRAFLEVTRAYLLLISHQRRDYDRELRVAKGRPVALSDLLAAQAPRDWSLLKSEVALWRGSRREAAQHAKQVLDIDAKDARAWAIMGDMLMADAKFDQAITMYNYAIQFDPSNQRYWELLNEAAALKEGRSRPRQATERVPFAKSARTWAVLLGVLLFVEMSLLWVSTSAWPPWLFGIPWQVLALAAGDGFLIGLVLAATDLIQNFDDEMVSYGVPAVGLTTVPVGLYLIPAGIVCFWLGVLFYAVTCWLDDHCSLSVLVCMAATALLTGLYVLVYFPVWRAFMFLGASAIFAGIMFGWMMGSLRILPWRMREPA